MIEAVFGEVRIRLHATCGHRVRSDQRRPRHSEMGMTGTRLAIAEHFFFFFLDQHLYTATAT